MINIPENTEIFEVAAYCLKNMTKEIGILISPGIKREPNLRARAKDLKKCRGII